MGLTKKEKEEILKQAEAQKAANEENNKVIEAAGQDIQKVLEDHGVALVVPVDELLRDLQIVAQKLQKLQPILAIPREQGPQQQ